MELKMNSSLPNTLDAPTAAENEPSDQHLVLSNLPLVRSIARRFCGRDVPFEDLIQEGCCALLRAARTFDAKKGAKFATYATPKIREALTRATEDQSGLFHLSEDMHRKIWKLKRLSSDMHLRLSRIPTDRELAASANMEIGDVRRTLGIARQVDNPIRARQTGPEFERKERLGSGPLADEKRYRANLSRFLRRGRRDKAIRHATVLSRIMEVNVMTDEFVADRIGVSKRTVARWRLGQAKPVDGEIMDRFNAVFSTYGSPEHVLGALTKKMEKTGALWPSNSEHDESSGLVSVWDLSPEDALVDFDWEFDDEGC
jgi:RNA polymerase sigma factor (sigma-70 family)